MDTGVNVKISIIVAMAKNWAIGRGGDLPWHLNADLKHFKDLTTGHTVIVGRKTNESIIRRLGKPLPNRRTIVVTRQKDYRIPGCEIVHSPEEALEKINGDEVFVIGGAEIYKLFMPLAAKIYLTSIDRDIEGDVYFPKMPLIEWECVKKIYHSKDNKNEYDFYWETYFRRKTPLSPEKDFVVLAHARYDDQRDVMKKIQEENFCPFCPENIPKANMMPVIKEGKHWHVRENRWPYKNTRVHLLIIHNRHAEKLADIESEAAAELFELVKWAESEHNVSGGAIGIRFGDPRTNRATVNHLHAHFIVANITDRDDPNYQPVRFRVG